MLSSFAGRWRSRRAANLIIPLRKQCFIVAALHLFGLAQPASLWAANPPSDSLKVVTQLGYLPQIPVLVRVEVLDASGHRNRDLWDAEAILSVDVSVHVSIKGHGCTTGKHHAC